MFEKRISLFKLFGFEVRLDPSWIIIAFLVTWSLASGMFPHHYKNLSAATYWWMGAIGALGLFLSIVFHEFCHSLVAQKFGMPMKGITLFVFGGIAEMEEEPPSPKAEFFMAFVGPLSSIFLGFLFHLVSLGIPENTGSIPVLGVTRYLRWINWILAGFNLLPAFPLDGGRIFRSGLWQWKGSLTKATRIASRIGSGFGFLLSFLGVLYLFSGAFIGGMWWILIGIFLRNASQMSYQRVLMRKAFKGETVKRFMKPAPVTAPASISVRDLVQNYMYRHHFKMFPVVEDSKLSGCVSTREIKEVPRDEWQQKKVSEILKGCSNSNTVTPDTDAMKALSIMNKTGNSRLMVVENNELRGIITLKDLLRFFSLKLDLEGESPEDLIKKA